MIFFISLLLWVWGRRCRYLSRSFTYLIESCDAAPEFELKSPPLAARSADLSGQTLPRRCATEIGLRILRIQEQPNVPFPIEKPIGVEVDGLLGEMGISTDTKRNPPQVFRIK
ncbi:MAG: hypothetical protein DMF70_12940 [Acidobacteria bacterium]|nr:MAG: hypothetical protein DMF70_12940 [Acidobacteriota bacterium]